MLASGAFVMPGDGGGVLRLRNLRNPFLTV